MILPPPILWGLPPSRRGGMARTPKPQAPEKHEVGEPTERVQVMSDKACLVFVVAASIALIWMLGGM